MRRSTVMLTTTMAHQVAVIGSGSEWEDAAEEVGRCSRSAAAPGHGRLDEVMAAAHRGARSAGGATSRFSRRGPQRGEPVGEHVVVTGSGTRKTSRWGIGRGGDRVGGSYGTIAEMALALRPDGVWWRSTVRPRLTARSAEDSGRGGRARARGGLSERWCDDGAVELLSSDVLEDPRVSCLVSRRRDRHGVAPRDGSTLLRRAGARRRRAVLEDTLAGLRVEPRDGEDPTAALLRALGLDEALAADVDSAAASYQPHLPVAPAGDEAIERLVLACGARDERSAMRICVLVQAHAAARALIDLRRRGDDEPAGALDETDDPDGNRRRRRPRRRALRARRARASRAGARAPARGGGAPLGDFGQAALEEARLGLVREARARAGRPWRLPSLRWRRRYRSAGAVVQEVVVVEALDLVEQRQSIVHLTATCHRDRVVEAHRDRASMGLVELDDLRARGAPARAPRRSPPAVYRPARRNDSAAGENPDALVDPQAVPEQPVLDPRAARSRRQRHRGERREFLEQQ